MEFTRTETLGSDWTWRFLQVTDKPVLVYPNSGETYDAETKEWVVGALSSSRELVLP